MTSLCGNEPVTIEDSVTVDEHVTTDDESKATTSSASLGTVVSEQSVEETVNESHNLREIVPFRKSNSNRVYEAHAQKSLMKEIDTLRGDIVYLQRRKDNGQASDAQLNELKTFKETLRQSETKLQKMKANQARQQKKRDRDKEILEADPELLSRLKKRPKVGRPSVDAEQPSLIAAIVDIATYGAGADARRRTESLRSVRTLDDLHEELLKQGFEVAIRY